MKCLLGISIIMLFSGCHGPGGRETIAPNNPLEIPDSFDSWERKSEPTRFRGAGLYNHINGGAEVFLELGFEEVEIHRFIRNPDEISLEIYRMTDPVAALGIYLLKCGQETQDSSFSMRHTVNRYQLQFFSGTFYVILHNLSEAVEGEKILLETAQSTARRIPPHTPSDVFALLPSEDRIAGTERVIRGPFTLQRIFTLGPGDILLLNGRVTALAADYESGSDDPITRIVVDYPDEKIAEEAFNHVVTHLDPYLEIISQGESSLVFKDFADRFGKVQIQGVRLEAVVNLTKL